MSILAEPKRKQKLSMDPQNLNWSKDKEAVGKKMLEKMGWSDGDGLGKNRQGMTSNLKLKANTRGKGFGATAANEYDSTWISHHDDFADLLSALNKNKSSGGIKEDGEKEARKMSLELNSKSLKRRIHYQKFTRAKDITNFDDNAKKSVFGKGITNKVTMVDQVIAVEKKNTNTPEAEEAEQTIKQKHMVRNVSVGDYFKDKMTASLAALKMGSRHIKIEVKEEPEEYSEEPEVQEFQQNVVIKEEIVEEISSEEITIIEEKKKKKKRKHARDLSDSEEISSQRRRYDDVFVIDQPEVTVKEKKKKKLKLLEREICAEKVEEVVEEKDTSEKRKKKSKKEKKVDEESVQNEVH